MISSITGQLLHRSLPFLVIEVAGIGYEIEATTQTFAVLPEVGEQARVYTHFVVREDAQLLFGFASPEERQVFRTLIKINGVGPKMALGILSALTPDNLAIVVQSEDVTGLQKVPGVGKKTAERLIIELRDKLKAYNNDFADAATTEGSLIDGVNATSSSIAAAGLVALGYKQKDVERMVEVAMKQFQDAEQPNSEEIIRLALRHSFR